MYSVLNTIIVSHLQTDEKNVLIIKYQLDINSYHRRAENDYNKEQKTETSIHLRKNCTNFGVKMNAYLYFPRLPMSKYSNVFSYLC